MNVLQIFRVVLILQLQQILNAAFHKHRLRQLGDNHVLKLLSLVLLVVPAIVAAFRRFRPINGTIAIVNISMFRAQGPVLSVNALNHFLPFICNARNLTEQVVRLRLNSINYALVFAYYLNLVLQFIWIFLVQTILLYPNNKLVFTYVEALVGKLEVLIW